MQNKQLTYLLCGWLALCLLTELLLLPLIGFQLIRTLFLFPALLALLAIEHRGIRLLTLAASCASLLFLDREEQLWCFVQWLPCVCCSFFIRPLPRTALPLKWDYLLAAATLLPFLGFVCLQF